MGHDYGQGLAVGIVGSSQSWGGGGGGPAELWGLGPGCGTAGEPVISVGPFPRQQL